MVRDAVERCIARISEAAVKLDVLAETELPGHAWSDMRGIGNILRHAYDHVDATVIWQIVSIYLPALMRDLPFVLARYPEDD